MNFWYSTQFFISIEDFLNCKMVGCRKMTFETFCLIAEFVYIVLLMIQLMDDIVEHFTDYLWHKLSTTKWHYTPKEQQNVAARNSNHLQIFGTLRMSCTYSYTTSNEVCNSMGGTGFGCTQVHRNRTMVLGMAGHTRRHRRGIRLVYDDGFAKRKVKCSII